MVESAKNSGHDAYDGSRIQVLKGLEAVRLRPGMYVGGTGERSLHHILYEITDNSVDEALAGYCDEISVRLLPDGSVVVRDNGRGIPVDFNQAEGMSTVEVVMTKLHAGGKFDGDAYKVSGGLHGVGAACTNALSTWFEVRVDREGRRHEVRFERGVTVIPLREVGASEKGRVSGTEVAFLPDPEIFKETTTFSYETIAGRLRQTAFLTAGLRLILRDERGESVREEIFQFDRGTAEFVEYLSKSRPVIHEEVVHFTGVRDGVEIDIALQYNRTDQEQVLAFANNIHTHEGGTHLTGFRSALTRAVNEYIAENPKRLSKEAKSVELQGSDLREGLIAIVAVRVREPIFEGQTKNALANREVRSAVESFLREGLKTYFDENPNVVKTIVERIVLAANARLAAARARAREKKHSDLERGVLPGKLADCSNDDPEGNELYIVEGDSAGGSAKQGRNRANQAILPLKGKILNVEKADTLKALRNQEIEAITVAIGCGMGSNFDMERLRYHKIILMMDADVDGAHIRTLVLTLFFRYFRELIEDGHIFIAKSPLYLVSKGKRKVYCHTEAERDLAIREFGGSEGSGIHVQRYKGLGEMNPDQLFETTMDPAKRTLQRVTITDALLADQIFTDLMGEEVEPRRKFIEDNALSVRHLDV